MNALKRLALIGFWAAILGYLGVHAFDPQHGIFSLMAVKAEIAEVEAELALARAERADLQDRVSRLSPDGPLDRDYLEERVRDVVNFAHPDEVIVTLDTRRR